MCEFGENWHLNTTESCNQYVSVRAQLCLTVCNHIDCSLPDSSVCGILQARIILEWVASSFSRGSPQHRDGTCIPSLLHGQTDSFPLSHLGRPLKSINSVYLLSYLDILLFFFSNTIDFSVYIPFKYFVWFIHKY